MKKYNRITYSDRVKINVYLNQCLSYTEIAKLLGKSISAISYEINNHLKFVSGPNPIKICKKNICNKCPKSGYCSSLKKYYDADYAQEMSDKEKIDSRSHPRLDVENLESINSEVSPRLLKGQSLYHIYKTSKVLSEICSEKTVRRYIEKNYLDVGPSMLPRYARYKKSYKKQGHEIYLKKKPEILINRTYEDYIKYKSKHKGLNTIQLDSVIGKITDKKSVLTIHFPKEHFQIGYLIDKGNPRSVNKVIKTIMNGIGLTDFKKLFSLIICDNGTEFSKLYKVENYNNDKIVNVFYANPYRSDNKAECERNHEFFRYIYPKHHSFENLTQEKLNEVFSHINSITRKSLNGKSPYEVFIKKFGKKIANYFGIIKVNPCEINLRSKF